MDNRPVGVYDSGLGGLTVWREIRRQLPEESLVYLGDGKNCPYGARPADEICRLADEAVGRLVGAGCKMVVVACNTATAAAIVLGVSPNAVKYGLAGFEGAGRRFDYKGKFQGADLYDDYAHHPSELRALLDAVDTLDYQRTIVVFQPHTYSRTAKLFNDFVEQLRRPTIVYLAEIYAAREKNTIGISSADLAAQIPGAKFYPTFAEIEAELRRIARPGDIILTVGAGDVFRIGEHLLHPADNKD